MKVHPWELQNYTMFWPILKEERKLKKGLDSIKEVSVGDSIEAIHDDKDGSTPKEPHILTDKL